MPKIYTKTGDDGTTSLFDGSRCAKDDLRVAAYGDVDELNAAIGVALAALTGQEELSNQLQAVQRDLFALGAKLANPAEKKQKQKADFAAAKVTRLEGWIDAWEGHLTPMKTFILPGGSPAAAALHLCRTVCRRAERRMITVHQQSPLAPVYLTYINRLSDYLFVAARTANREAGTPDIPWS